MAPSRSSLRAPRGPPEDAGLPDVTESRPMSEPDDQDASAGAPPPRAALRLPVAAQAALLLAVVVAAAVDLLDDLRAGASHPHLVAEAVITLAALAGLALVWRQAREARQRARDLAEALDRTRVDLVRWRAEAEEALRGLGAAIDRQFERWGLSPAEREVALHLLKGLSLKDAALERKTSERTVRQQALAVYRKAGLAGRAELAAFFLEDLLLPPGEAVAPRRERG